MVSYINYDHGRPKSTEVDVVNRDQSWSIKSNLDQRKSSVKNWTGQFAG